MHYLIIAVIVIVLVVTLFKYVLFNPILNSVLSLIFFIVTEIYSFMQTGILGGLIWAFLIALPVADCIVDIARAKKYYEDFEIGIDKLYLIKSLTSLFTFGLARVIFLLIVGPCISLSVKSGIRKELSAGHPLSYESKYSLAAKNYYYRKHLEKLERKHKIISNKYAVDEEVQKSRKKLDDLYPQKMVDKVVELASSVSGNEDTKRLKKVRKRAANKLSKHSVFYAYINGEAYGFLFNMLPKIMSDKGFYSASDIQCFGELAPLNLTYSLNGDNTWGQYFIIQVLYNLVAAGEFEEGNFNDNDPFDNHVYRYMKSTVNMPSIDADSDPRFALDD